VVCRSKHVEPSLNSGMVNSITRLHLVGYFTWVLLQNNHSYFYLLISSQSSAALKFISRKSLLTNCFIYIWIFNRFFFSFHFSCVYYTTMLDGEIVTLVTQRMRALLVHYTGWDTEDMLRRWHHPIMLQDIFYSNIFWHCILTTRGHHQWRKYSVEAFLVQT
jgi:hypothetical protein